MKKLLLALILISLMGCGYVKHENKERVSTTTTSYTIRSHAMTYRIYDSGSLGGLCIVNETLDSLKLEEYKNKK
jgi:hypothetical protein